MRRRATAALTSAVILAGCVSPPPSPEVSGTPPLRVRFVPDYPWPASRMVEGVEIDVFPLVDALVVDRHGGLPLGPADEATARQAASAYCGTRGATLAGDAPARVADGAIAFPACVQGRN